MQRNQECSQRPLRLFPVAFRTIPSAVMLRQLPHFGQNWFIVLASDDQYSHQLLRFQAPRACIALQETLPVPRRDPPPWSSPVQERIRDVGTSVLRSHGQGGGGGDPRPLLAFLEEAPCQNLTGRVWIAAEAWATDLSIHSLGNIFGAGCAGCPCPRLDNVRVRGPFGASGDPQGPAPGSTCHQICQGYLPTLRLYDKSLSLSFLRVFGSISILKSHRLEGSNPSADRAASSKEIL